jgi:hypothetical protein
MKTFLLAMVALSLLFAACTTAKDPGPDIPIIEPEDVDLQAPYPLSIHMKIDRCTPIDSGTRLEGRLRLILPDNQPETPVVVSDLSVEGTALVPQGVSPSASVAILGDPNFGDSLLFTIDIPHEGQADGCSIYLASSRWHIPEGASP